MKRLVVLSVLTIVGCAGSPQAFDAVSPGPPRDARRCVADRAEDAGFMVTETPGDERLLEAKRVYERPDTSMFLGLETVVQKVEWGRLEVLALEERGGSTSIRYEAATGQEREGPWHEPSPYMIAFAESVREACS